MQVPLETRVRSLGGDDLLEESMAAHSSILAWRIPGTEEPDGLTNSWTRRITEHTCPLCGKIPYVLW